MSMIRFTREEEENKGIMYSFAMKLIDNVVVFILNDKNNISDRIARARSYLNVVKYLYPAIYKEKLSDLPEDYTRWDSRVLEKIAEALSMMASDILAKTLGKQSGIIGEGGE